MRVGLLTDRIDNKLEKSNLINEHALIREPVPSAQTEERQEIICYNFMTLLFLFYL